MNLPTDLPHNGIELVGLIILTLVGWAMYRQNGIDRKLRTIHQSTEQVASQVVNGHAKEAGAPNLRDDLDEVKAAMRRWEPVLDMVPNVMKSVVNLSQQVSEISERQMSMAERQMTEEDRRRAQISDLRDELDHRTGHRRRVTE